MPTQEKPSHPLPYIAKEIEPIQGDIQIDDCIFRNYQWLAPKDIWKGRILFIHGYRDSHRVYYELGENFAKNGYDFFFFYQRGEGESKLIDNSKGVSDDYYAYKAIDDMIIYNLDDLKKLNKPPKLHLLGLSMGGGLCLNYACFGKFKDKIKSFSAICPLILLHKDSDPGIAIEYVVRAICYFNFGKKLRVKSPLNIEYITGDEDYQNLMKSYGDTAQLTGAFVETRDFILRGRNLLSEKNYSQIDKTVPLLICHGEADRITDVEGSKRFISLVNSIDGMKNKQIITYKNGRHQLICDIPEVRHKVIPDLLDFYNKNND